MLDAALDLASSLVSFGFETASKGIEALAVATPLSPDVIMACVVGFLAVIVAQACFRLK